MRSFISRFSPWIAAVACILAIEACFDYKFNPSRADRSNFVSYGQENNFAADQMEEIIYQKLRMEIIPKPDFLQVGDSSGFFGIIPEVVEQYLSGMKYLNASCCATQGFNGYLALLRFNLRRLPSVKYMVVYSGILAAFPGPLQWRDAPKTLDVGFAIKTMGAKMETTLTPPWDLFALPTNSLRKEVLQQTFLSQAAQNYVNTPKGQFETIVSGLQARQGYGLEMDDQSGVGDGAENPQCNLKYETFFDWGSMRRKSYLDAFVEEYVSLAREYHVVPVFAFQISPCTDTLSEDVLAFRENLQRLQHRFPELKIPFDIIDTHPANIFSVPLHVQRNVAHETSRRLGRALHEIITNAKITVEDTPNGKTLVIMKATRVDACDHEIDLTAAFASRCDGKGACAIDLKPWHQTVSKNTCKATYVAEFKCADGPARIVRQETETGFGGKFKMDCQQHDSWPRDNIPRGILVADADFGGSASPRGKQTLRTKAFCDGLLACNYVIRSSNADDKAFDFASRWYCGSTEKRLSVADAKNGSIAYLACP